MRKQKTTRARSEQTRNNILDAAIKEFGENGFLGARTEAIAAIAGVNKALLHYYFKDKEGLYKAVLLKIVEGVAAQELAILDSKGSEGERLLRWALQHFDDRMIVHRGYQKLFQQEMIRAREGASETMAFMVKTFFRPLYQKVIALAEAGIRSGELCEMDPIQVAYAILGPNVFYFMSAHVMQQTASFDPLAPASLKRRRESILAFLGQALFTDRKNGQATARQILSDTPMPKWVSKPSSRRKTS